MNGTVALPVPNRVLLRTPWGDFTSDYGAGGNEIDDAEDDDGTIQAHWFAFNDDPAVPDAVATVSRRVDDEYILWISMRNPFNHALDYCDRLSGNGSARDATALDDFLHVRLDDGSVSLTSRSLSPRRIPRGDDPLSCRPGRQDRSRFRLVDLGLGAQPLLVDGSPRHAEARLQRIEVKDWHGADRLEITGPGGQRWVLKPGQPTVDLVRAETPKGPVLVDLRWHSSRSTPGAYGDPEIELLHACPTNVPSTLPVVTGRYPLRYDMLDEALAQATQGLRLQALLPQLADLRWPALDVDLVIDPVGSTPFQGRLTLSAHGAGPLLSIPLAQEGPERWRFSHTDASGTLEGEVERRPEQLEVRLLRGELRGPMGPMPLSPATLVLPLPWGDHAN